MQKNKTATSAISKKEKTLRILFVGFFLCIAVALALPLLVRDFSEGMLFCLPALVGFLLAASPKLYRWIFHKRKWVSRLMIIAWVSLAVIIIVPLTCMLYGGYQKPQPGCTVIVLGCQVRGETPSPMLKRRIDVALTYAKENPESKIIASGGRGDDESISEAECIRRVLVANGIAENRIYIEDRSTDTRENLQFSAEIIVREGLNPDIVIATSRFHEYRASLFAKRAGLESSPLPCHTRIDLLLSYWSREIFAVWRLWILGY